jgi:hypothetical protein
MRIARTEHFTPRLPLIPSFASAVVQLLVAGLIGTFWLVPSGVARETVAAGSLVVLLAALAIRWRQTRADAQRRFLSALDAYAERELIQARTAFGTEVVSHIGQ